MSKYINSWVEQLNDTQLVQVHSLMLNEWWCSDRSLEEVRSVVAGSDLMLACLNHDEEIIAFSRVLTDRIFKAVLFDVIVRPDYRARGLGKILVGQLVNHPMLLSVRSIELYCPDRISGFYKGMGFVVSDSKLHHLVRNKISS